MYILGISAFYHDSAAVLIKDGKIVIAVEEERFSRIKHDNSFPSLAIEYCLKYAKINISKVGYIAYYEKPLLKFERILQTFVETFPYSLSLFLEVIPEWIGKKIKVESIIRKNLSYKGKIFYIPHHLSHAAAGYFTSGFKSAAILTIDGVGEYQTTGMWIGKGNQIMKISELKFPDSLGLLYSTFTAFLGFKVNEGEYKMMGLSAYGKPKYVDSINKIIKVGKDGSFKLDLKYFGFRYGHTMWSSEFEKVFGKPRDLHQPLNEIHKDIAASIQQVTEDLYIAMSKEIYRLTKQSNICISGGVGLNALANGKLMKKGIYKKVHIIGCSGDSGGALGAALYVYFSILAPSIKHIEIKTLSLGSEYDDKYIERVMKNKRLVYKRVPIARLPQKVAKLLGEGKIIGLFHGRMEFGPRALGNRSILADPLKSGMKNKLNKLKERESFRPFGGVIAEDKLHNYFDTPKEVKKLPYMNFCIRATGGIRGKTSAVQHVDGTTRVQTINRKSEPFLYEVVREFGKISGVSCIVNTSFNSSDEPIVESPEDALRAFKKLKLDYLVIGSYIVSQS